jgi:hypothetical protein
MTGEKPKNARQKQVDVHLAVDMINHAVRQNLKRASLLTGDLDFKPAIKGVNDRRCWRREQIQLAAECLVRRLCIGRQCSAKTA